MTSTLQVDKATTSRIQEVDMDNLDFGRCFTDHMFEMHYANNTWKMGQIKPYGPIEISPALNVLHYGQAVFEGMKAFYVDSNKSIYFGRMCTTHDSIDRAAECVSQRLLMKFLLKHLRHLSA